MDREQYLHQAKDCLDLATLASNEELRDRYLQLARQWMALAEYREPEPMNKRE